MRTRKTPWGLAGLFLGLAFAASLAAQSRLYVLEPDNAYHPVFKVAGGRPYIMDDGKLVAAKGTSLALKKVEEYLPVFITVQDVDARTTDIPLTGAGGGLPSSVSSVFDRGSSLGAARESSLAGKVASQFHFDAKFLSSDPLEDVFLVLESEFTNAGKSLSAYEIGRLEPGVARPFAVDVARDQSFGSVKATLHLFVGGAEVFQSEQPADFREAEINRMIASRIAGVKQAGPRPFFGSAPVYPATLRQSGLRGEALVTMVITAEGTVRDPVVGSASAAAFGEAALAAVRPWRFVPRVQDGRAVEVKVSIPFVFDPPKAADTAKE